jgi:hypothetical protein
VSSHIAMALIVAIGFVLTQVYLIRSLLRRSKHLSGQLNDLRMRGSSSKAVSEVVWFEPFVRSLTNTVLISDVREVALRQAEEDIHDAPAYELLQKLSVTAPLIGVILTSAGFAMLGGTLDDIRTLALPLASGVFVGAVLAILNQFMLFWAESSLRTCTAAARNLIDQYWVQYAARLGDPHRQLEATTEKFEASVSRLALLIDEFPKTAGPLTSRFSAIGTIAEATFRELAGISGSLQAATKSWANAAQQVSASVDKDFLRSIDSLKNSSLAMDSAARDGSKAFELMRELTAKLDSTVNDQRATFLQLEQLVQSNSKWTKDTTADITTELSRSIGAISAPLKSTAEGLSTMAPHLSNSGEILAVITKATGSFSRVIEQDFVPANKVISELSRASIGLSASVENLNRLLEGLDRIKTDHTATQKALEAVIMTRALPTVEVLQRATGAFEDSAHRIAECSHELSHAITELLRATSSRPSSHNHVVSPSGSTAKIL